MATIRIPRLVGKTNQSGLTSWYWQPSASLGRQGWKSRPLGTGGGLGQIPGDVAEAARRLNQEVDGAVELTALAVKRVQQPLTVDELAKRYKAAGFPSVKKTRQGRPVAASTQRQYKSKLRTISAWGEGVRITSITAERVARLRDALMVAVDDGSEDGHVRHYAAHETLRVARTLFTWAEQQHYIPKGANPFEDFGLGAPEERDQVWWAPHRAAVLAEAARDPALELAIDLAFSVGQREADLLRLLLNQYVEIPIYKMDPDVYASLSHVPVPAIGERPAYVPGDVRAISLRQAKGKRWVEVPIVGETRARVEAQVAAAKKAGVALLLFDRASGRPWTQPNIETGQTRFIRDFLAVKRAAIAAAAAAGDDALAAELADLQFRDFRRTAVVYQGELGIADQLISAVTGHTLDRTKKILEIYMPRTTGMAARAIALSQARGAKAAKQEHAL